ncbi:MAG: acyl-CoA dehydrogenase [Candidatus Melainabacteria bacterium HGW-Melainabacteria-1]|nr:MAG: acyl-CoA dehydrogenase [Candidatus Melainabacteria bacterium HGW-Melainabacteria-1]
MGADFYQLDDLLTEDERMVRDTVRSFVEEQYLPIITDHYRNGTFPHEIIPKLGELGLLGPTIEGYGCAGLNAIAYGLICQELERGDSGLRSFASVQSSLVMYPIYAYGSEAQKEKWLPQLAAGTKVGCFGLTEPDFGSNPSGMITRARKSAGGYVLNGAKMWITSGSTADIAVVWAKDDEGEIRGFLVEKGTPGFSAVDIEGKFSLRASVTSELILENCEIPAENMLPHAKGLKGPLGCLSQARYGIAWGALGAAMACYDTALNYSKARIQFDKPIASFQLVQQKLVYMITEITKGQLLAYRLGQLKDQGKMKHPQISMAKMNNVKIALDISRIAREVLGANGIADEYPIMRHMTNLESVYTYEGTHDIHALTVGREVTGIAAFA